MSADASAVREALAALDAAFARGDLEAVGDLCTEDVLFIGSGDGEVAVGRKSIIPMVDALVPHLEHLEFSRGSWESVEIDVRGDLALLSAHAPAELATPSRKASFRYQLTGVLVRNEGRWLWRVFHGSEPGAW